MRLGLMALVGRGLGCTRLGFRLGGRGSRALAMPSPGASGTMAMCWRGGKAMVQLTVPVAELKERLEECLARVRGGDTVLVVDGDEVVAQAPAQASQSPDDRPRALVAAEKIEWGGGKLQPFDRPGRLNPGGKTMAEIVEELRD